MTRRLTDDERMKRAMARVVESQRGNYQQAICAATTYHGPCGLEVFKDGRRPWEHVNSTAHHRVVVDRSTVR